MAGVATGPPDGIGFDVCERSTNGGGVDHWAPHPQRTHDLIIAPHAAGIRPLAGRVCDRGLQEL